MKPEKAPRRAPRKSPGPPGSRPGRTPRVPGSDGLRGLGIAVSVAALTIYLGFNAGGFFPVGVAVAAVGVIALLALGLVISSRPFERVSPALAVALGLLGGFAIWTLASALWSGADGRALVEFDRVLLYVAVLAFFGLVASGRGRLEWGLRGFAAAAVAICAIAWTTRVAADVWPIALNIHPERLSYPLTYWNALGLLATLGIVAGLYLSSGERQSRGWRIAAAASIPLLGSTLLLTFSRGSLAVAVLGLAVYALLARPPRLLTTIAATTLPAAVAMAASYRADVVGSESFASAAGVAQGHDLALTVVACVVVAAGLRALLLKADTALEDWIPPVFEPRAIAATIAVGAVALIGLLAVFDVPARLGNQYDAFVNGDVVEHTQDPSARLSSAGNNGRLMQAEVALESFAQARLRGTGAGTYELEWNRLRPEPATVADAHNLYAEVLGELGVVGFALLAGALLAIFVGLARRLAGEERHLYAATIALTVAWAVHAGIDWDWEMPAITAWLFALAGLGLARSPRGERSRGAVAGRALQVVPALGLCVLALVPAAIAVSQHRLDSAVASFDDGDCEAAIAGAQSSLDVLDVSSTPYEVLGYCDARLGHDRAAEKAMESAVSRDPDNWAAHYGLALVRALAGRDPVPELREAERLNPLEPGVRELLRELRGGGGPREWERRAMTARLPL